MKDRERRGSGRMTRKMQRNAEHERKVARQKQAHRVMPFIGELLDAWEGSDISFRSILRDQYPSLHDAIQNIHSAYTQARSVS